MDVVKEEPLKSRPLNAQKAEKAMNECIRHANFANPGVASLVAVEDWEESLSK